MSRSDDYRDQGQTNPRIGEIEIEGRDFEADEQDLIIYDRENHQAWVQGSSVENRP